MIHSIYISLISALGKTVLDGGWGEGFKDKDYIDLDLIWVTPDWGLRILLGLSISNLERSWANQEELIILLVLKKTYNLIGKRSAHKR